MANKHIIARVSQLIQPTTYWSRQDSIILKNGEIGMDSTLNIYKIGDGVHHWSQLPVYEYFTDADSEKLSRTVVEASATAVKGDIASADVTVHDGIAEFDFVIPPGESFTIQITSSNGSAFRPRDIDTTLECHVFINMTDITNSLDAWRFNWKRVSEDPDGDIQWNTSSKAIAHKTVVITSADCSGRTVFNCDVNLSGL